jgi:adenylate cyclase
MGALGGLEKIASSQAVAEEPFDMQELVGGNDGGWRRLALSLFVLFGLLVLCAPLMVEPAEVEGPTVSDGQVDFSSYGEVNRPVELLGDWAFEWAEDQKVQPGHPDTVAVPGLWTNSDEDLPPSGRATYRTTVKGLEPGQYSLFVPLLYAASNVSIDGELRSSRGVVGSGADTTTYEVRSHLVHFETEDGTVDIAIDMAAFHHRDNGLEAAPVIGSREAMADWTALRWARELLYNTALILVVCVNISVYMFRRSDKAALYLALANLAFMPSAAVLGFDNIMLVAFPAMSFQLMLLIQYVSGSLAAFFFFAYAHALYPKETPRWLSLPIYGALGVMAVVQAVVITLGQTFLASQMQPLVVLCILFTLAAMIAIGAVAWKNHRTGAGLFFVGMALFVTGIIVGALVTNGLVRETDIPGYSFTTMSALLLLFPQVIIMADRWALAITEMEDRNIELKRLLDINTSISTEIELGPLLRKLVGVTSQVIEADRSSLFIWRPESDELVSKVAEGMDGREIRLKPGQGIAGACFISKQPIFVSGAYTDDRFDRSIDAQSGYITQSILAVPIIGKDGSCFGVMQALNRRGGEPFGPHDLMRMKAFASQAAIAIENANLFSEVLTERNYNDSILSSLRNGVITVDRSGKVIKSNAAARSILSTERPMFENEDIGLILKFKNANIDKDFRFALTKGQRSSLIDVDLETVESQRARSVNLSVAPLERETDKSAETLIVIEDISESKRLNSTLRRFMPQEIVDEVLGKDQESLFGSSVNASVLFADIRKFTSISETMTARETVDMLNEVFGGLCEAISATEGVVDKFIGDAIMAVYGVPLERSNDAQNAVAGGLSILRAIEQINTARSASGHEALKLGVGISTGEVVAGTIGSQKRMDYTVIGDTVNLASRLQSATKSYGVEFIISEATRAKLGPDFTVRNLDVITVRGRQAATNLYEVIDPEKLALDAGFEAMLASYAKGRALYDAGDFASAADAFQQALDHFGADRPSQIMLERARALAKTPPAGNWNGIWSAAEGG